MRKLTHNFHRSWYMAATAVMFVITIGRFAIFPQSFPFDEFLISWPFLSYLLFKVFYTAGYSKNKGLSNTDREKIKALLKKMVIVALLVLVFNTCVGGYMWYLWVIGQVR